MNKFDKYEPRQFEAFTYEEITEAALYYIDRGDDDRSGACNKVVSLAINDQGFQRAQELEWFEQLFNGCLEFRDEADSAEERQQLWDTITNAAASLQQVL